MSVICQDIREDNRIDGESSSSSIGILKDVNAIYEDRLKRIDEASGCGDGTQVCTNRIRTVFLILLRGI